MASKDMLIIVGRIITPKMMDVDKREKPDPPRQFLTSGTIYMTPKNPYTTEGIPASNSRAGFKNIFIRLPEYSERYIAQESPRGAPIISAPNVTRNDDTIMGNIPNEPFVGAHLKPKMIFLRPTLRKSGRPSNKIKMKITNKNRREDNANIVKIVPTNCSFPNLFLIIDTY